MKNLKFWLSFTLLSFIITYSQAQEKKKIYFLVDTVNISPENRIVDINGRGEVIYTFYCKCLEIRQDILFTYLESRKNASTRKKPNETYISWKKLLALVDNDIIKFDKKYELYITEVLPNKKYNTNRVYYSWTRGLIY